ncbi:MAG: hypothetical protein ACQETI_02065 [Halobacteriota archaeon]
MSETTIDTIRTVLESVLRETEDAEIHFKLRTALQLLAVIDDREKVAREALKDSELDEDLRQQLRELGYLSR